MEETAARIDVFAKAPPDPRFSTKVGDFVERPIFNAQLPRTTAFWRRIYELLPRLGDPRLLARAHGFPSIWAASQKLTDNERAVLPKRFARIMPELQAAYRSGVPELDADAAATCAAIITEVSRADDDARATLLVAKDAMLEGRTTAARQLLAQVSEVDLLAAVYASPSEDQPRRDYAAWLVLRNDPRGQFIEMQLRRTGKPSKREKELLAEHKTRWLGPLAKQIKLGSALFERGFLDRCALKGTWEQVMTDDPAWSTVRSIALGNGGMIQLGALTRPLWIESITWEVNWARGTEYGHEEAIAAFHRLQLPRLREVRLYGEWFNLGGATDWIESAPCVAQLERLETPSGVVAKDQ
jgi:uncharacterized protein (TIGR02996 family)